MGHELGEIRRPEISEILERVADQPDLVELIKQMYSAYKAKESQTMEELQTTEEQLAVLCARTLRAFCEGQENCKSCPFRTEDHSCAIADGYDAPVPSDWEV